MHLTLLLSLCALLSLILASKLSTPDDIDLPAALDGPPVVLDLLSQLSPEIHEQFANLEMEEKSSLAALVINDSASFKEKVDSLLKNWCPLQARILWLSTPCGLESAERIDAAASLLWKSIEEGDLTLLRDYAENFCNYYKLGAMYFHKYGLKHVIQINGQELSDQMQASLKELIESLPLLSEENENSTVIALLQFVSRPPPDHKPVKIWGPPSFSLAKAQFLFGK